MANWAGYRRWQDASLTSSIFVCLPHMKSRESHAPVKKEQITACWSLQVVTEIQNAFFLELRKVSQDENWTKCNSLFRLNKYCFVCLKPHPYHIPLKPWWLLYDFAQRKLKRWVPLFLRLKTCCFFLPQTIQMRAIITHPFHQFIYSKLVAIREIVDGFSCSVACSFGTSFIVIYNTVSGPQK